MNYKLIDMNTYKRKDHFNYFRGLANPYVGTTVDVDITGFLKQVKEEGLPFFLTFCYFIANAANSVSAFRQRIVKEQIAEYEHCMTSHTVALPDGTYCYCTLDSSMPLSVFLPYAIKAQKEAAAHPSMEDKEDTQSLFFISTVPWLTYRALVQPTPVPADSNPRLTWGRYYTQNNKILLPVSVLCNHALVDGLHIAEFYQALDRLLCEFCNSSFPE